MTRDAKKPLYRKVNSRTHHHRHGYGGEARWDRNSKASAADERMHGSMHPGLRHGLDYTPLYRFLLSRVGQDWAQTHSEAVSRLNDAAPIWRMVALERDDAPAFFRTGESSFFSCLYVDKDNILRRVDPDLDENSLAPFCTCCTHTLNGKRFTRPFPKD